MKIKFPIIVADSPSLPWSDAVYLSCDMYRVFCWPKASPLFPSLTQNNRTIKTFHLLLHLLLKAHRVRAAPNVRACLEYLRHGKMYCGRRLIFVHFLFKLNKVRNFRNFWKQKIIKREKSSSFYQLILKGNGSLKLVSSE